ncbi:MAG: Fe-S cluster assembly protein SufD [Chlorobi bacterium]|nr:Fe-S cluster assembly protein SufD [Chlorobiota bacterium]MCI0716394.1 Fe-S cluster assembly protein SufD [Chlorobiota bacterium]
MEKTKSKDWYLSSFKAIQESLNGSASLTTNGKSATPFHDIRKQAIARFEKIDFPTTKNEDWKYTNIAPILNYNFTPVAGAEVSAADIEKFLIPNLKTSLIVLLNGNFSPKLSKIHLESNGVRIESFRNLLRIEPDFILEHFAKYAQLENGFVAFNTAFADDGAVIYVPDNTIIDNCIHILNVITAEAENILSQPRNLIVAGRNSKIKIIEGYHSISENVSLTNVVNEIIIGESAEVELYRIQNENLNSFHINRTQAEQKKGSVFTHYSVSLGGRIMRNDTNTVLDDENCTANLYGLYLTEDSQHIDNHTLIDHAKPHCQSNELYKGVLNDNSRGVFNGKVFVRKDAQKTNAYQSNKAILLSNEALVDTKPQLEIYADDVKCSHGAAIGQLDEDALFYLRTRGIGKEEARTVLIRAFANDIFETIENEALHDYLNNLVFAKLK